jgi:MFS family permease
VLGFYNFIGSMFYGVLVLYAQEVLQLSAFGYGQLMAAQAVGGLAGSLIGPAVLRRTGPTAGLLSGVLAFTLCTSAMALSTSLWLIAPLMMLEAFGNMLWNIASVSYRQRKIPTAMMGRVNAAFRFFGTGPASAGSLTGGAVLVVAAGLGPTAALHLMYGIVAICAAGMLAYSAWRLRLD